MLEWLAWLEPAVAIFMAFAAYKVGVYRRAADMYRALEDASKDAERRNWTQEEWHGITLYGDIIKRTLEERGL